MHRFESLPFAFLLILAIGLCASCACGNDDSSSEASAKEDDSVNDDVNDDIDDDADDDVDDDANDDSTNDDQDDDLNDDIDDDTDDDTDDGCDSGLSIANPDSAGVQDMWCQNLGTVPPEPGWVWEKRFLGQWEDGNPQGYVTYSGDTLYAYWGGALESTGERVGFLGRLEDDQWTQWQIEEAGDSIYFVVGLITDGSGGVWSLLCAPADANFPRMLNLVRWEEGQIAEVLPVFDDIPMGFIELFILQDGRFAFTYFNGAGAFSVVEQTSEGDFIYRIPVSIVSSFMHPDTTGVWHAISTVNLGNNPILFDSFGTVLSGFQSRPIGLGPESPCGAGSIGTAIDSDNNIYATLLFGGGWGDYFYLVKYDGTSISHFQWSDLPDWDFGAWPIMGINSLSQPYFIVAYDLPDDLPEDRLCMLTHTDNGTSSVLIDIIVGSIFSNDVAYSNSNEIALIGDNHLVFGPSEMTLYYRQRDEKTVEN
jgi:hypothetical protein